MSKMRVTGVNNTIHKLNLDYQRHHSRLYNAGRTIATDFERQAKKRAPFLEGTLRATGTSTIRDRGAGRGFTITCGFDAPYAMRLHEAHYQAHRGLQDYVRRTSKRSGNVYHQLKPAARIVRTPGGMVKTGQGVLVGRKYITRAWDDNKAKYESDLQNAVK